MYQEELKIPKERIPILIGKKGVTRRQLENNSNTKIVVNSQEGDVLIKGEESLDVYNTRIAIQAIGRGFNPDIALHIITKDYLLEIVNMKEFASDSKESLVRIKARIIGTEGKTKHILEQYTNTDISIYGKTVSIIGEPENAIMARRAVEMILKGSKQGNIYLWLEKQQKSLKEMEDYNKQ